MIERRLPCQRSRSVGNNASPRWSDQSQVSLAPKKTLVALGPEIRGPSQVNFIHRSVDEMESGHHVQEDSNEKSTAEIIHRDYPPKLGWFFGAVDPSLKACPRFSGARPNHSREKGNDAKNQKIIRRPDGRVPLRHE